MKLVEINWKPTDRQLRQFGAICLVALPVIGWFWSANITAIGILAGVGLLLAVGGWIWPQILKPIFLGLSLVATPIGMVVGELAMLFIYYAVFLPFGLVFRAIDRDALQMRVQRGSKTYWQPKKQATSAASYYRQS